MIVGNTAYKSHKSLLTYACCSGRLAAEQWHGAGRTSYTKVAKPLRLVTGESPWEECIQVIWPEDNDVSLAIAGAAHRGPWGTNFLLTPPLFVQWYAPCLLRVPFECSTHSRQLEAASLYFCLATQKTTSSTPVLEHYLATGSLRVI